MSGTSNTTTNITTPPTQPVALYKVTISQPDAYSRFIRMDTDIYNTGEVVEFVVTNNGKTNLRSPNDNPCFSVIFQTGRGTWATKMGPDTPVVSNGTYLRPGESSKVFRFTSEGWEAGRYRIVSDYGVEHDFLIRNAPVPAPVPTCAPAANTTPWIAINSIPDHLAGEPFTITGNTNIAAGRELRYQIFAAVTGNTLVPLGEPVTISVAAGSCGTNTWSADVMMPEPSMYFIGLTDETKKVSAIKRFTVQPAVAIPPSGVLVTPGVSITPVPPTPQVPS
jgi:hypothetical protein